MKFFVRERRGAARRRDRELAALVARVLAVLEGAEPPVARYVLGAALERVERTMPSRIFVGTVAARESHETDLGRPVHRVFRP